MTPTHSLKDKPTDLCHVDWILVLAFKINAGEPGREGRATGKMESLTTECPPGFLVRNCH